MSSAAAKTGPDFIIIGAMKAGTSTLYSQLAGQEGVFLTTPKEPNFFSDDAVYAKGLDWYRSLFAEARPGDLAGEASTHYTKLPTYPETLARMQAGIDPPRLIYVIRNPVARAVSHFMHEHSVGAVTGTFDAALGSHPEMIEYGRYAMQIRPYIEAFGQGAVHLTSLEQIKADPDGELAAIGQFLNHEAPLTWDHGQAAQNVSAQRMRRLPLHGLLFANPVAKALRQVLIPAGLRARLRAARTITDRPELSPATRQRLEATFAEDHAALSGLFPDHPALTLCYPFLDGGT